MKKLFVLLMVVGLVIAGRGMASAALSWSMPDTLSVTPGSQVTVPVYMSVQDAFDLGAISLSVLYDSSKFDYVGYAQGSWNSQFVVAMGDAAVPGNFRAGDFYYPVVPLSTGDGTLLTFTLQAKTIAPLGFSALTLMDSQKVVTPVKTGVQTFCKCSKNLDSGFRRNDGKRAFGTFYEAVNL